MPHNIRRSENTSYPPGPTGNLIFGHLFQMREYEDFFRRGFAQFPKLFSLRLLHQPTVVTNFPPYVQEILVKAHQIFLRPKRGLEVLHPILGDSIVTSEGEVWRSQREALKPGFQRSSLAGLHTLMVAEIERLMDRWEEYAHRNVAVNMPEEMSALTFGIFARTLLAMPNAGHHAGVLAQAFKFVFERVFEDFHSLFIERRLPTARNRSFRLSKTTIDTIIDDLLVQRATAHSKERSLIDMLLEHGFAERTVRELRQVIVTLVLAGYETTANTLTWLWYYAARYPESWSALPVLSSVKNPTDDTSEAAERFINETLRLRTPLALVARQSMRPYELGGFQLKPGTLVLLPLRLIHQHPDFWIEPDAFVPARFTRPIAPGSFMPFLLGPHRCLGAQFALDEMILTALMARARGFSFHLLSPTEPVIEPGPFHRPKQLWVKIKRGV